MTGGDPPPRGSPGRPPLPRHRPHPPSPTASTPVSARREPLSSCFPPSSLARLRFPPSARGCASGGGGAFPTPAPRSAGEAEAQAQWPAAAEGARARLLTRKCFCFPGGDGDRSWRRAVSMQRLLLPPLKAFVGSRSVGLLVPGPASRAQVPTAAGSHRGSPAGVSPDLTTHFLVSRQSPNEDPELLPPVCVLLANLFSLYVSVS